MEDWIGSIETSQRADLLVLDHNLLEMDRTAIHTAESVAVIRDGEVTYGDL
jgi:predicted amidohydrolase YtcJ